MGAFVRAKHTIRTISGSGGNAPRIRQTSTTKPTASLSPHTVITWPWDGFLNILAISMPKAHYGPFILSLVPYGMKHAIAFLVPILIHSIKYNTPLGIVFAISK